MNRLLISVVLSWCGLAPLLAASASTVPRLAGIVGQPDRKLAILETIPTPSARARYLILSESSREGDVKVSQIDPEGGVVKVRVGRTNAVLSLSFAGQTNDAGGAAFRILLDRADMDSVLRIYSEFTSRTLLRSPRIPASFFTLAAAATNPAQAALVLEKALAEKGITTIPDGDKFLMVVPDSEVATAKPNSLKIETLPGSGEKSDLLPVGVIYFQNGDLTQVAQIYAELIERKLDQTRSVPPSTLAINLRNQTPLSKAECVYALDTLFRWQGMKVIPITHDLARLVTASESEARPDK